MLITLHRPGSNHPAEIYTGEPGKMQLIEEIDLPNGLKLNLYDLSREIAADTVKVEITARTVVRLHQSFFANPPDYETVRNIFGEEISYEYRMERTFVTKENRDAVLGELISTFKKNSLHYLGTPDFAVRLAASKLREIKNNPYKYQNRANKE